MKKHLLWLCILFLGNKAFAHPMPSSVVDLSVLDQFIRGEARIPLLELSNAVGDQRTANLVDPFFTTYFSQHIKASSAGKEWMTSIEKINIISDKDPFVGNYQEVVVQFTLRPPNEQSLRKFTFNYDAVIHQVVTHSALVSVRQDWAAGLHNDGEGQAVGVIQMDVPTGKIYPLSVNLEEGSLWKGFKSMLSLGMQHIKDGTDHLLFLIVLLLPAMLLVKGRRWTEYGGLKYSLVRLLKIVTAFTIGHSITLLLGALSWIHLPSQPIEILIAVSILVSAVHAIRPIFPGKETLVAAGFGLIHGLAFALVLSNLELSTGKLALSILGFNLGIELMQLFIIAIIVPWLILLRKTAVYKYLRISGAAVSGIAAIAWITERSSGQANFITDSITSAGRYAIWFIAALALLSLLLYFFKNSTDHKTRIAS